jgi:hypothetical protein
VDRDLRQKKPAIKRAQTKHRPDSAQITAIERLLDDEPYKVAICRIKPLVQRFPDHGGLHRTPMDALKHGDPSAPEDLFSPC